MVKDVGSRVEGEGAQVLGKEWPRSKEAPEKFGLVAMAAQVCPLCNVRESLKRRGKLGVWRRRRGFWLAASAFCSARVFSLVIPYLLTSRLEVSSNTPSSTLKKSLNSPNFLLLIPKKIKLINPKGD